MHASVLGPARGRDADSGRDGRRPYVSGLSVVGNTAVMTLGTATSFGEVLAVDLPSGAETILTDHGDGLGDVELYPREDREFSVSDGTVVQGWIIRDREFEGPAAAAPRHPRRAA